MGLGFLLPLWFPFLFLPWLLRLALIGCVWRRLFFSSLCAVSACMVSFLCFAVCCGFAFCPFVFFLLLCSGLGDLASKLFFLRAMLVFCLELRFSQALFLSFSMLYRDL